MSVGGNHAGQSSGKVVDWPWFLHQVSPGFTIYQAHSSQYVLNSNLHNVDKIFLVCKGILFFFGFQSFRIRLDFFLLASRPLYSKLSALQMLSFDCRKETQASPLNEEKWIVDGSNELIADFFHRGSFFWILLNQDDVETSKQQDMDSRLWILDQSEAMAGQ